MDLDPVAMAAGFLSVAVGFVPCPGLSQGRYLQALAVADFVSLAVAVAMLAAGLQPLRCRGAEIKSPPRREHRGAYWRTRRGSVGHGMSGTHCVRTRAGKPPMGPGGAAEEGKGTGEEAGGNKQRQNAKGAWGSNLEKRPAGSPARTIHGGGG